METRPYTAADESACLSVFDSNVPDFFAAAERSEFEDCLRDPKCTYVVMEHAGELVGCGGYYVLPDRASARLAWGMVRRAFHKQGLGRFLLMYRMKEVTRLAPVQTVSLTTTPLAAGFFASQGFQAVSVVGDRTEMIRKLAVCA